jgi:hypothetical protein
MFPCTGGRSYDISVSRRACAGERGLDGRLAEMISNSWDAAQAGTADTGLGCFGATAREGASLGFGLVSVAGTSRMRCRTNQSGSSATQDLEFPQRDERTSFCVEPGDLG